MSDSLQVYAEYASAFEETFGDDDWSRLEKYFSEDARYEVSGSPFACKIYGRNAVFAGLKKSIDGFDRKFSNRELELTAGPTLTATEDGGEIRITWNVHYQMDGALDISLSGGSFFLVRDGVIQLMRDEYRDEELGEVGAWLAQHGVGLNGAYV